MSALTRAKCKELAPFGVRVNAISPGFTHSEGMGQRGVERADRWVEFHCPMGRHADPEEMAGPVVFLASDPASFVTGVTLPVDGGPGSLGGDSWAPGDVHSPPSLCACRRSRGTAGFRANDVVRRGG